MPTQTSPSSSTDNPMVVRSGQIAELVLNAPDRKNALPLAAWQAFPDLLSELARDPAVRVCILRGAGGKSFCAGADISEFEAIRSTPEAAKRYDDINVEAFRALKSLPVPVIAAIEGPCLGGGLGLALACDLRIASRSAFFAIPAARLGLAYPPEALGDLLEAVSPSNAKRLLFSAVRLKAEEALDMGLVNEVVDDQELNQRVIALSEVLCANAPLSLKAAKQAINRLAQPGIQTDPAADFANAQACIDSADYREGCRAFLEKRAPVFTGN
ncbi:enoyl-CoA hydratase [Roseibium sp. LAB1]